MRFLEVKLPFSDTTDYSFGATWNPIAAVYGIMKSDHEMIYIGQTDDLKRRMEEHQADSTHCMHRYSPMLVWAELNANEMARLSREITLIAEYSPPCNA